MGRTRLPAHLLALVEAQTTGRQEQAKNKPQDAPATSYLDVVKLGYADAPAVLEIPRRATPGGRVQMQPNHTLPDGSVQIPLHDGNGSVYAYAIVDAADAEWANQWHWRISAKPGSYAYRSENVDGKAVTITLHRALCGLEPGDGLFVDHIDRSRLNNRRINLRVVPRGANAQNVGSKPGATSAHRGVSWDKRSRRWRAQIHANGRVINLGLFVCEQDAAAAAAAARSKLMPYAVD